MREINKIYIAGFLQGFGTIASVTYTLFFLSHGLSQTQIGTLFSFFMITLALMEIPTGAFSDTLGHKTSIALGSFIFSLSFLLFLLLPTFVGFLIGMFFAATGLAFQSGAISSLLHDILQKTGEPHQFEKIWGKMSAIFLLASIVSAPLGSLLYERYKAIPYFIAFLTSFLSAVMIYSIKWEFHEHKHVSIHTYFDKIHKGVLLTIQNRRLLAFVIIAIALTTIRLVFNQNINQPYLLSVGISIGAIGVVAAIVSGVSALIQANAYKLTQKIGDTFSLFLMIILPSICAAILGFLYSPFAVLFIILFHAGHAYRDPVLVRLTQKELHDENRATMASTGSFLSSIIVGLLLPFWGGIIDKAGLHATLIYLALFTLTLGTIAVFLFKGSHRDTNIKSLS